MYQSGGIALFNGYAVNINLQDFSSLKLIVSAGTCVFVINYTGDRLNFGLAVERFNGGRGKEV